MQFKYRYKVELSNKKTHMGWMTESNPQAVVKALWKRFDEAVVIYVEEEEQVVDDDAIGEGE